MHGLFSFPNPVNETSARVVAAVVAVLALVTVAFQQGWLLPVLAYGFVALALVAVLAVFASLEAAFGLCVGCRAFYLGMRLGLVPPHVYEDCARVLAAR